MNIRIEAAYILTRWEEGGVFAETLIHDTARVKRLSPSDRAFLNALVLGVLRHRNRLDYVIDSLRGKGKLDADTRTLLRLGLCQLFVMELAPHAAVHETVSIAPKQGRGLVNALLRRADRERDEILRACESLPLHVQYSIPKWIIRQWQKDFGEEDTLTILRHQQEIPLLYARKNPMVPWAHGAPPSDLSPLPELPSWYRIEGKLPLDDLNSGALYIGDPSTRHAIELLNPQQNEHILDACAAPGGKSVNILAQTKGQVHLIATDAQEYRLAELRENLEKFNPLDLKIAHHDWTQPCPPAWLGVFDAVLLDVPCSNTGVMQRRVDVRWRLKPQEITRLTELQLKLLTEVAPTVKSGGRLVYSTCSIDSFENQKLVERFLATHPEWKLERDILTLPLEGDGSYAALLTRQ